MLPVTGCLVKDMHWPSWLQMLQSCLSNGISAGLPQIWGVRPTSMVFWVTLCREKSEMILLCSWNRSSLLAASLSKSLKCLRQHGGNISLCQRAAEEVQAGVLGINRC